MTPAEAAEAFANALIPVYPATAGPCLLERREVRRGRARHPRRLPDPLPPAHPGGNWSALADAFRLIHRPESFADIALARKRLVYEEAFVLQVELARRRAAARALPATPRVARPGGLLEAFDARLPFTLTAGQVEVGEEIAADLAATTRCTGCCRARSAPARPSSRCARCSPSSTPAGRRRCSRRPRCSPSSTTARSPSCSARSPSAGCSAGPTTARGWRCSPARWGRPRAGGRCSTSASGDAGIVVGTHALLEERVQFADLGLVVVDEQHRFGVEQRAALTAKGDQPPHVLVMTATPIPRTVAMTVFGDLRRLDAHRAARRGVRRSPRTSCRRGRSRTSSTGPGSASARRSPPGTRPTWCARASAPAGAASLDDGDGRSPTATERRPADRGARPPVAVLDVAPSAGRRAAGRAADRGPARPAAPPTPRTTSCAVRRRADRRPGRDDRRSRSASTSPTRP